MALFEIDVLGVIAKLRHETKLFEWVALLFQLGVSLFGTFLFSSGTALLVSRNWVTGIGSGMVATSVVLVVFTRRSSLLKGMMFVFPAEEATKELGTDIQVIERPE